MIPSSPSTITGGDEIRGRDGTTCRQGSHVRPTVDFGVTSTLNNAGAGSTVITQQQQSYVLVPQQSNNSANTVGIYARVIVPLGKDSSRVDCTQLYALEIERLRLELERLRTSGSAAVTVN